MAEVKTRQMVFSVPEGGEVVITSPEPMTRDSIQMVEELCALWFRRLHRHATTLDQQAAGEAEYASWNPDGVGIPQGSKQ